jgi:hypothetical protein
MSETSVGIVVIFPAVGLRDISDIFLILSRRLTVAGDGGDWVDTTLVFFSLGAEGEVGLPKYDAPPTPRGGDPELSVPELPGPELPVPSEDTLPAR